MGINILHMALKQSSEESTGKKSKPNAKNLLLDRMLHTIICIINGTSMTILRTAKIYFAVVLSYIKKHFCYQHNR